LTRQGGDVFFALYGNARLLHNKIMARPVIDIAQMRSWETATWSAGITEPEVIDRAGQAVAAVARRLTQPGNRIVVVAGKGHNGDDARVAARHLTDRQVQLVSINAPETDLPLLNQALSSGAGLLIDGLFGIGLSRPLTGGWALVVETINQAKVPVLAVDVPSGLNADTGEPMGTAVQARTTLTLGAPKAGLLKPAAWAYVGRLEVAPEIGLVPCPFRGDLLWSLPGDFAHYPPERSVASHKGTHGHLLILAGSMGYHGAAVLAAQAALRARPGLVTVVTSKEVYLAVASQLRAAMVWPWQTGMNLPENLTAILMGPGLAGADIPKEYKSLALQLWTHAPMPVVVDASALGWLSAGQVASQAFRAITPHPGEVARLLKTTSQEVQANRVGALREVSAKYGQIEVVLKGHQTLIGKAQGEVYVNSTGSPSLGQGGSGDILAGYLGGLLAQPSGQKDGLFSLRYGVWQHGASAEALDRKMLHWTMDDLLAVLGGQVAVG
jgi:ADP-dependent NAD(P)H-hydrate dehydratase / NAD(P)H-hydrate epimerase